MTEVKFDFGAIRAIGGEQHKAFEELGFQLLTADIDRTTAHVVRTGDPDGGLEWYVTHDDGTVEGWQAKYITSIETLLSAMTKSVNTVAKSRSEVTKMTFVIPWNLPDGKVGKSARTKYNEKVEAWKRDIDGADRLSFELVGRSELLEKLALPQHQGRAAFFWDKDVLGFDQLRQMHSEAAKAAGRRYRPELQVDVPIQSQIDSLGLAGDFFERLDTLIGDVRSVLGKHLALPEPFADTSELVIQRVRELLDAHEAWRRSPSTARADLEEIELLVNSAVESISALSDLAFELDEQAKQTGERPNPNLPRNGPLEDTIHLRKLARPVNDLRRLFVEPAADLAKGKPYFLSGDGGSGKTHLVLDASSRALSEGRPSAMLFGEWFSGEDVFSQLAIKLGLSANMSKLDLLTALDACGAVGDACRFILAIDALNETTAKGFWANNLSRLAAAIEPFPHIGLVVTARSTYLEDVDPERRRRQDFVAEEHPGLLGVEREATGLYFSHYGLEEPRHPLLTPEFANPLFLQIYCESFVDNPGAQHRHQSRAEVFERLVDSRVKRVASQVADTGSALARTFIVAEARKLLDSILDQMADSGAERLTLSAVHDAIEASGVSEDQARRLLARLEAEGLFTSEEMWIAGSTQEGLRLTFQAFGDYLIFRRRLDRRDGSLEIGDDSALQHWLEDASFGIQEAASVMLPEEFGVELADYLRLPLEEIDPEQRSREDTLERMDRFTLDTLAFRSPASITDKTFDAINRTLNDRYTSIADFYSKMCMVAPIPDHPLNANRLHRHLEDLDMATRDAQFGIATYHALDHQGTVWRLAEWALRGPYLAYDDEVIELASVPLVWLLSSPNRYMRDWLTKVLVKLLAGHPNVLAKLVARFEHVDDLYVRERLAGVVYGVLMRSQGAADPGLRELVAETARAYLTRPPANALLLDYVEGIVEYGLRWDLVVAGSIPNHKIRYGLPRPDNPWTKQKIDDEYGHDSKSYKEDRSYTGIYSSVLSYGDFGRYEIDSCFRKFSTVPIDQAAPTERPRTQYRTDKRKLAKVLRGADPDVLKRVQAGSIGSYRDNLLAYLDSPEWALSAEIDACKVPIPSKSIDYPVERAKRWVFMKAIKLGWTPERFAHFERYNTSSHGRSATKAERFGKKYQWLAYHELLARVRDNFHPMPSYASDAESEFDGLWATYNRDIDPSVPPIGDFERLGADEDGADDSFEASSVHLSLSSIQDNDLERYLESEIDPLTDYGSFPSALSVLDLKDQDSDGWLLLNGRGGTRVANDELKFGMSMDQTTQVRSWLVRTDEAQDAFNHVLASGSGVDSPRDLHDTHGHTDCCYVGELGWRDQGCYHCRSDFVEIAQGQSPRFLPSVEDYFWERGRFDCSITDSVRLSGPSAGFAKAAGLLWDGESSWRTADALAVLTNVGDRSFDGSHGFAANRAWLLGAMKSQGWCLILRCWTERRDFRPGAVDKFAESASVLLLNSGGQVKDQGQTNGWIGG